MLNMLKKEVVIDVKNLTKNYGNFSAVKGITFQVFKGEVFGLLGENGAGKTTTLEIIEGLRKPSGGEVRVLDHPLAEIGQIKQKIGIQLQSTAYYNFLTLKEILALFASFYGRKVNADELLGLVDLSEKANSYLNSLSGGQKQRFSIAASLVNDPQIIFLDEPTTGLDPLARRQVWELIEHIRSKDKTIILTTHYMEEAERLCNRIAIMDSGKLLVMDSTPNLLESIKHPHTLCFSSGKFNRESQAKLSKLALIEQLGENDFVLKLENQNKLLQALKEVVPLDPQKLKVAHATLEDLFIELTGKKLEE